jgi:hypothetical protein
MVAQPLPVRVLWDPIPSLETGADSPFQGIKRSFFVTHYGERTPGVIQDRVVVGS